MGDNLSPGILDAILHFFWVLHLLYIIIPTKHSDICSNILQDKQQCNDKKNALHQVKLSFQRLAPRLLPKRKGSAAGVYGEVAAKAVCLQGEDGLRALLSTLMPKVSKYGQNQRASTVMTMRARLLCFGEVVSNVSPALDFIKFTISRSFWSLAARELVTADLKCISISSWKGGLWSTYQTSRKHRVGVLSCLSECCTTNLFLRQNTSLPEDETPLPHTRPSPREPGCDESQPPTAWAFLCCRSLTLT